MKKALSACCAALVTLLPVAAHANASAGTAELGRALDTVWVLFAGSLVFFMNAGFALVESGFCRRKNAANILAKNFVVFAVTTLVYFAVGFAFMFGNGNDFIGLTGFFVPNDAQRFQSLGGANIPVYAKFFFQLVFAGTAATIVSGAVAERIHYRAFIAFSVFMGALVYPIVGHWIWGGGFLAREGMLDFAGSSVVHSVGGWAALVGAWILGPRLGKYGPDRVVPIPGHNMTSATLGTLILWLGWFGFNPGSTLAARPDAISHILVTTNLAAASGGMTGALYTWWRVGKPELALTLNGCLAGLVGITAACAFVSPESALVIGCLAGIFVVEGVILFDRLRIDDPVGATSVHLINGILGTLCVGLFAEPAIAKSVAGVELASAGIFVGGGAAQLLIQLKGVGVVAAFSIATSTGLWYLVRAVFGLRVPEESEMDGLDVSEMGMEAYPDDLELAPTRFDMD